MHMIELFALLWSTVLHYGGLKTTEAVILVAIVSVSLASAARYLSAP